MQMSFKSGSTSPIINAVKARSRVTEGMQKSSILHLLNSRQASQRIMGQTTSPCLSQTRSQQLQHVVRSPIGTQKRI